MEHKVISPGLSFIRNFDEPVIPYTGAANVEALDAWIRPLMIPTIFEFTDADIATVFEQELPTLFLFRDSATDKDAAFMDVFAEAAKTHKGKLLFSYSDIAVGI